jgi:hypothetical protein
LTVKLRDGLAARAEEGAYDHISLKLALYGIKRISGYY